MYFDCCILCRNVTLFLFFSFLFWRFQSCCFLCSFAFTLLFFSGRIFIFKCYINMFWGKHLLILEKIDSFSVSPRSTRIIWLWTKEREIKKGERITTSLIVWVQGQDDSLQTASEGSIVDAHDLLFTLLHWVLRNNKLWITQYQHGPAPQITTKALCWRFAEVSRIQFHSFTRCNDEYVPTPMIILVIPPPTQHFCPICQPLRLTLY